MVKDHFSQISCQNVNFINNFLGINWSGGYPSAKLQRKREGPCFAQALITHCNVTGETKVKNKNFPSIKLEKNLFNFSFKAFNVSKVFNKSQKSKRMHQIFEQCRLP